MISTEPRNITIVCDMAGDLAYACIGPRYSSEYKAAEERDDYEAMDALDAEQDRLADDAGEAWEEAASRIATAMGYEAELILTKDDSVGWSNTDPDDDGQTVERRIWQEAHEGFGIGQDDSGRWVVI